MKYPYHQLILESQSKSQKEFKARGSSVTRCINCLMAEFACFCQWKVNLSSSLHFVLIMHSKELYKPTNSGRLIADLFPHSTNIFLWSRTDIDQRLISILSDKARQPILLFPETEPTNQQQTQAISLGSTDNTVANNKPITLILLDGTWKQAARMARLSPWLKNIPRLAIEPNTNDTYIRQAASKQQLSTAQAASYALNYFDETQNAKALRHYFSVFNHHCVATRANKTPTITSSHDFLTQLPTKTQ
jgi:DTW domain-containing protein YfiP